MHRLRRAVCLVTAALTAALDLWSKALWDYPAGPPGFDGALEPTHRAVFGDWFFVHTTWNPGGAWSAKLPGWLLLSGTIVAVPLLAAWIFWPRRASAWDSLAKSLVLGGAVGNLYDRWTWGQVRDWIDVWPFGWHYPTFNVADAALVVGIAILLLGGLRKRPPESA
jgi:lipoprotein signal peptidase